MMKPYVVDETLAHNGAVLTKTTPQQWKRPISSRTADILTTMMIGVVNQGTGRKMKLANGIQAAAKTGTAQLNATGPEKSNAWIVGFAPADAPRYAVAVILKGGENDEISESTGGTLAGPIAKQILDYLFAHDGR
jgi:peptidoglycan glycosyltransferase